MPKNPVLLIILDGFGYSNKKINNAIYQAHPDFFLYLLDHYPSTKLKASGTYVGQLPNMIGNSEVGHLTIGSGRTIKQPVVKICKLIETGEFFKNKLLINKFIELKKNNGVLHIIGLLSDAGVHSYDKHLFALLKMAVNNKIQDIIIHVFLDGRDSPPKSAYKYLEKLELFINTLNKSTHITIGSIHGRFYAMDRDNNWDRTQKSYNILVKPQEIAFKNWQDALNYYYDQNQIDEFITPTQLNDKANIKSGDGLIFFNFRADRAKQLMQAILDDNFKAFKNKPIKLLWTITFTNYNQEFKDKYKINTLLEDNKIQDTLLDILEKNNKTIFTIAETEKYAHVTYFFNGGKETLRQKETRVLIPSAPKKSYKEFPQMRAKEITNKVIASLEQDPCDFYVINYANADMVAHSGDFDATVKAIKILDEQLDKLYKVAVLKYNATLYITGDHGNAEQMWDYQNNQTNTSHTTNLVYFLVVQKSLYDKELNLIQVKKLSNIAPFILKQLNIKIPLSML